MTVRRFRTFLTGHVLAMLAAVAASFLPGGYSDQLRTAYESEPYWLEDAPLAVVIPVVLAALTAIVAGIIGLYRLKRWGRSLSLATTVGFAFLIPFSGPMVASGLEDSLWELSSILWGAVLALAYYSPVAAGFHANNSSKPTPLRGAA
jgi:hypothetical protein